MRAALFAVTLALPLVASLPAIAHAQRAGTYNVTGTGIDGTPYTGQLILAQAGLSSWRVQWLIGPTRLEGVGMTSGNTLAIAFNVGRANGMSIYNVGADGTMIGQWTMIGSEGIGTEMAVPQDTPNGGAGAGAAPKP